ncbi:MAG TPA: hypothetical protein PLL57_14380, partial [Flavobacteriales bacterium]|nr:hypothetical protein [Flavobacteriales bacterium]
MNRTYALLPKLLTFLLLTCAATAMAQTRYWVGGDGRWEDVSHWSTTQNGTGGASVPRADDDVVMATTADLHIAVEARAECRSLLVNAGAAAVRFEGHARSELAVAGELSATGEVRWDGGMAVRLTVRRQGVNIDPRGASIAGDLILDGSGSWSVISDLRVDGALRL